LASAGLSAQQLQIAMMGIRPTEIPATPRLASAHILPHALPIAPVDPAVIMVAEEPAAPASQTYSAMQVANAL
jgi:hypothetical protein